MPKPDLCKSWKRRRVLCVLGACLLSPTALVAGCGHGVHHDLAPVSGRVSVHGKPLAQIGVSFQPVAAPGSRGDAGVGSYGITDSNGHFEMRTLDGKLGAVVGKHVIRLSVPGHSYSPESDIPTKRPSINPFPPSVSNGSLTFEVPSEGTDKAQFDF